MPDRPSPKQVHPFPARMAPELALEALDRAPADAVVLDPMCGSGTVLHHARESGKAAIGFDIDPLAILISRVRCTRVDGARVERSAARMVDEARAGADPGLSWVDSDPLTAAFIDFWFHKQQRGELRRLAAKLHGRTGKISDVLRVALSRTIITKDSGASLARDVSHSRPHRVRDTNDFDVYDGFLRAARRLAALVDCPGVGTVTVSRRDARRLPPSLRKRIDLIVTSPPYLNAIDYMRGHRMSLVWLGYQIRQLRVVRSTSVGAERYPDSVADKHLALESQRPSPLSSRQQGMLARYARDVDALMGQFAQVLSDRGQIVLVVGDSLINGVRVSNSDIIQTSADRRGLRLLEQRVRPLPTSSRYLPPPSAGDGPLSKRMRRELIMRFAVSQTSKVSTG